MFRQSGAPAVSVSLKFIPVAVSGGHLQVPEETFCESFNGLRLGPDRWGYTEPDKLVKDLGSGSIITAIGTNKGLQPLVHGNQASPNQTLAVSVEPLPRFEKDLSASYSLCSRPLSRNGIR